MKPTVTYSEFISHKDRDLEIRGESFDAPVRKTDSRNFYTQVSILENGEQVFDDGQPLRYSFELQNDEEGLKDLVGAMKNNEKLLPK